MAGIIHKETKLRLLHIQRFRTTMWAAARRVIIKRLAIQHAIIRQNCRIPILSRILYLISHDITFRNLIGFALERASQLYCNVVRGLIINFIKLPIVNCWIGLHNTIFRPSPTAIFERQHTILLFAIVIGNNAISIRINILLADSIRISIFRADQNGLPRGSKNGVFLEPFARVGASTHSFGHL